jgi:glycosyltransferase involved in cell wall biosynthesis
LKYKGVEVLINATDVLFKKDFKIELVLAGTTIKRNFFLKKIYQFFNIDSNINENLLKKKFIKNLGFIKDINNFYKKIDILCFPSSLNSLGRQIFEAGMHGIPSIVCLKKNYADSFINKKTGLSFKRQGDLKKLENIIEYFYLNRKQILAMGNKAKKLIKKNHSIKDNLKKLENIYLEAARN